MHIEKLPSGSYRITQTKDGHRYRVTVDHKPEDDEAIILMAKVIQKRPVINNMRFDDAAAAFIESKSNILSPSTKREYVANRRKIPEEFSKKHINTITTLDVQKLVNDWASRLSPKTVHNYAGFVMSVLKSVDVDIKQPQLPQKVKKDTYIPTENDVRIVREHFIGTKFEVAFFLACLGVRRSELCALTPEDLDGNVLTINKAKVQDENKKWVIKTTKTTESTRTIVIPEDIANKIREQGFVFKGDPGQFYKEIQKIQDKEGLPRFQLHKLRHFFASFMHDKGFSDKQIQEMGGWKTDNVMKTVYQHAMNMTETKAKMSDEISNIFS